VRGLNYFLTNCEQTDKARRIFWRGGFENMRDPMLAGILSFIIPGVGQLYNGRILAGILWLIFTPGFGSGPAARSAGSVTSSPLTPRIRTRKNIQ
jgi:protein-S-isoprenylcysteine O-methyltransferase Ste14